MHNKRGLTASVMNLILGILAVSILVYALWPTISSFLEKGDRMAAERDINQLQYLLNSLNTDESGDYFIYAPVEWNLASFEKGKANVENCFGKDCVCIRKTNSAKVYFCREIKKKIIDSKGGDLSIQISPMKLTFVDMGSHYAALSPAKMPELKEIEKVSPAQEQKLVKFNNELSFTKYNSLSYDSIIKTAAESKKIDPNLVKAIMYQETRGLFRNPLVVGDCGEAGFMQFMPGTAQTLGITPIFENAMFTGCQDSQGNVKPENAAYTSRLKKAIEGKNLEEAIKIDGRFSPQTSIEKGVQHILNLYTEFNGNILATIAAYNRGSGGIRADCCPAEGPCAFNEISWKECVNNKDYLYNVLAYYDSFSKQA